VRIWAYAHTNAIQMKRENLSSMGISFICIFFRYWERMERHKLGMFNFPRWIWCIENWTVWSFVKPERIQQRESALASQSQRISQPGAISSDINWVNKLIPHQHIHVLRGHAHKLTIQNGVGTKQAVPQGNLFRKGQIRAAQPLGSSPLDWRIWKRICIFRTNQ